MRPLRIKQDVGAILDRIAARNARPIVSLIESALQRIAKLEHQFRTSWRARGFYWLYAKRAAGHCPPFGRCSESQRNPGRPERMANRDPSGEKRRKAQSGDGLTRNPNMINRTLARRLEDLEAEFLTIADETVTRHVVFCRIDEILDHSFVCRSLSVDKISGLSGWRAIRSRGHKWISSRFVSDESPHPERASQNCNPGCIRDWFE
jgi:hypothetical protein